MDAGEWMVGSGSCSLFPASHPAIAVLCRLLPLVWLPHLVLRLAAVVQADGAWGRGGSVRPEQSGAKVGCCPVWCAVNHDVASDELDDVIHESAHSSRSRSLSPQRGHGNDGGPERRAVPAELYLVRYQYAGEADEWLYLGDGYHGLEVSPETAQRLRRAIGRLMDTKAEFR